MTLRRLLLLAMAYLLVLALVAFGIPLVVSVRQRVSTEVRSLARSSTDVVAITAAALVADPDVGALSMLAQQSSRFVRGRVVIVDASGRVLADSAGTGTRRNDYSTRPEIAVALRGRRVQAERQSTTLGQELLVTSSPIVVDGRPSGAVRLTQDVGAVERSIKRNVAGLGVIGGFVLVLGLFVATLLARRLSRPLLELEHAAVQVAAGNLDVRATEHGSSEQRSLTRAFNAMTERVARALDTQQAFVADASHHLRTPLSGLRLRLEALSDPRLDARARQNLDAATTELDRLSQTIDELLLLSTTGEHDAPGEPVSIAAIARSAVGRWHHAASERGQELVLSERRPGVTAWASPIDLQRALDVLLENAVRYSPPASTIAVVIDHDAIEVLDQGPGLGTDSPEDLFQRFRRGAAGRSGPSGSGLGLAIARELTSRWGGETTLVDVPGGGACARLRVPQVQGSRESSAQLSGALPDPA